MKGKRTSIRGFTLVELMVALSVMGLVLTASWSVFLMHQRMSRTTRNIISAAQESSIGMGKVVYGFGKNNSMRETIEDSVVLSQYDNGAWRIDFDTVTVSNNFIRFLPGQERIRGSGSVNQFLIRNVVDSSAVLTNGGLLVYVAVRGTSGGATWTNEITTFTKFRN